MTVEQKLAADIVARFGDPEVHMGEPQRTWAEAVAEFVEANPAPVPVHGRLYSVASLGECRAVGRKPGHEPRIWVFERQTEPGRTTPQPQYVAIALDTNLWEAI